MSPTKGLSGRSKTVVIQDLQNVVPILKDVVEVEKMPHETLNDMQQENQDALIKCVMQDVGFEKGKDRFQYLEGIMTDPIGINRFLFLMRLFRVLLDYIPLFCYIFIQLLRLYPRAFPC
jgi:hypothetical protein